MSQGDWQHCTKCQGLFFAANSLGYCPAGGAHNNSGSANYYLSDSGPGQSGWKWCNRCQGLWFFDDGAAYCPAHPHSNLATTNYVLSTSGSGQSGWKWCNKCQSLFFSGNNLGVCADLGTHDDGGSDNYVLSSSGGGQSGWKWCNKCQVLFYAGNSPSDPNRLGLCPAGGTHNESGSENYNLPSSGSGQSGWRWCIDCQALFYSGINFGVCPTRVRTSHAETGSDNYVLSNSGDGQSNWRWCKKCQGLFFAGVNLGVCPVGGAHDDSGSGDYVLDWPLVVAIEAQAQLETNWCWAAVASSISQYVSVAFSQCEIVNQQVGRTDCCINPSSSNCNQSGYLDQALQFVNCFAYEEDQASSYTEVRGALLTNLPPCIRIGWSGGGGHFIIIKGLDPNGSAAPAAFSLLVSDPIYGDSWVTYEALTNGLYQGSGTWTNTYFTTWGGT